MASSKRMNLICVIAIVLCVALSVLLPASGAQAPVSMGYEGKLFDVTRVHAIDISMENWNEFLKTCMNEEYAACDVTVDGEKYKNVAIRAKGNTSLSSVSSMNSNRYSFKIEFDHFDSAFSYHGLDKLSLNNVIQDNTFMKDYLTYRMMNVFDVPAPLTSFVYITVNGEDWGLYLAVEGVEDSFLMRNYGKNHGELYKPDSMDMGGGRGNGKGFDMGNFEGMFNAQSSMPQGGATFDFRKQTPPDTQAGGMSGGFNRDNARGGFGGMGFGGMGSSDVKLVYSDDNFESYSNIFENAKTDVTDADKTRLIDAIRRMNEGDTTAVNVEDVIRYFVVHNFVVNDDSYTGTMIHNYYLYEKDGALSMIPWDYNLAYGTFQGGNASSSVNRDIMNPVNGGMDDRPMVKWIFDSDAYADQYKAYFAEFISTVDAVSMIAEAQAIIAPYVEKDPTKFCSYEEFEKGVSALKTFVELRSQSVRNQLDGSNETVNTASFNASDMGTMGGMGGKGNMQMPEMPIGGMNAMTAEGTKMPEMPVGEFTMPEMPAGEFTMPDIPAGEFPMQQISGKDTNGTDQTSAPEAAGERPFADSGRQDTQGQSAENREEKTSSSGNNRTNPGGIDFSGRMGAAAEVNAGPSGAALLMASICVLIASIAIALFIKR